MTSNSEWICTNPDCELFMKRIEVDYYKDHEGYPVVFCKWGGDAV